MKEGVDIFIHCLRNLPIYSLGYFPLIRVHSSPYDRDARGAVR